MASKDKQRVVDPTNVLANDAKIFDLDSWPLLRLSEISLLSMDTLRACLDEIDVVYGQDSQQLDPLTSYARRQREKVVSTICERAAHERVRKLLAGESVDEASLRNAQASIGEPNTSVHVERRHGRVHDSTASSDSSRPTDVLDARMRTNSEGALLSISESVKRCCPNQHAARSPVDSGSWAMSRNSHIEEDLRPSQAHGKERSIIALRSAVSESALCSSAKSAGESGSADARISNGSRDGGTNSKDSTSSINSTINKNWGSVFIVGGGGKRRRRLLHRKKTLGVGETPAERRAHMEKGRLERRTACLCRLLARKRERAKQQEAKRRRKAIAGRAVTRASRPTAPLTTITGESTVSCSEGCHGVQGRTTVVSLTGDIKSGSSMNPSPHDHVSRVDKDSGEQVAHSAKRACDTHRSAVENGSYDSQLISEGGNTSNETLGEVGVSLQAKAKTNGHGSESELLSADGSESESVSGGDSSDGDSSSDDGTSSSEKHRQKMHERIALVDNSGRARDKSSSEGSSSGDGAEYSFDDCSRARYKSPCALPKNENMQVGSDAAQHGLANGLATESSSLDETSQSVSVSREARGESPQHKPRANHRIVGKPGTPSTRRRGEGVDNNCCKQKTREKRGDALSNIQRVPVICALNIADRKKSSAQFSAAYASALEHPYIHGDDHHDQSSLTNPNSMLPVGDDAATVRSTWGRDGDKSIFQCPAERSSTPDVFPGPGDRNALPARVDVNDQIISTKTPRRVQPLPEIKVVGCSGSEAFHGRDCSKPDPVPAPSTHLRPLPSHQSARAGNSTARDRQTPEGVQLPPPSLSDLQGGDESARTLSGNEEGSLPEMLAGLPNTAFASLDGSSSILLTKTARSREKESPTVASELESSAPFDVSRQSEGATRLSGTNAESTKRDMVVCPSSSEKELRLIKEDVNCSTEHVKNAACMPSLEPAQDSSNGYVAEVKALPAAGRFGRTSLKITSSTTKNGVPPVAYHRSAVAYTGSFSRFAAILSAHHNGRALTREVDGRSLPLTSGATRGMGRGWLGLTKAEEEACLYCQWKLYTIYIRVIKDYATVFSYGDGWTRAAGEDPSSLVYSGDPSALHYRVNSKSRPEVYNIVTDVLNNRCKEWEELPTGLGLKTTWNLLWTWSKPRIKYSSLLTWQKVNHFPNSRELTRKDLLNKHILRFVATGGRLAREFHIMPQTFVLPHEFTLFVAAFTSKGYRTGDRRGRANQEPLAKSDSSPENGLSPERDVEGETGDDNAVVDLRGQKAVTCRKSIWIMKPVGMSRGRGIRLVDDIKNISYSEKVVVQRYVGNPLLLDGYKFDLRLYVLVTSFNRLEAFIYKEGFARLSTHLYEEGDIGNRFIHITNSSIQRLNDMGAARDSPLRQASTSEAGGTKTTLSYLWRRLAATGVDVGALWAGICSVVVKSLVCVEGSIPNQPNSFELFGYDVLIDERLRPWLIEVNSSPSMARETHVDRQVKEALIYDIVHLVDPLPFNRQKLVDVLGRRLAAAKEFRARPFKQYTHLGGRAANHLSGSSFGGHKKDEDYLNQDLIEILDERRPRQVGELPNNMGNFVRLCPGTAAHRHAKRLRRRVVRPHPEDDGEDELSIPESMVVDK